MSDPTPAPGDTAAPSNPVERDADRAADLMAAPDYWRNPAAQREVRQIFVKYYNEPEPPKPLAAKAGGFGFLSAAAVTKAP